MTGNSKNQSSSLNLQINEWLITRFLTVKFMGPSANQAAIVVGSARRYGIHIAKKLSQAGAKIVVNFAGDRAAAEQLTRVFAKEVGQQTIASSVWQHK
jgi:hypothetical protein